MRKMFPQERQERPSPSGITIFQGSVPEDGHPCMEQAPWRSPNLKIDRFQALLHVLGFPNGACSYPAWAIGEEDFIALLHPSSPAAFSQEEMQMVQLLFPEFELNLKKI